MDHTSLKNDHQNLIETPSIRNTNQMNYLHHSQAGYGWNDSGEREPIFTPDVAEIIDGAEETEISDDEAIAAMGRVMNQVLEFCFQNSHGRLPNFPPAFRRFCCVVWVLQPQLFSNESLSVLSPHLHVTRASLSKIVRTFCGLTGVRNIMMKTETACLTYSKARKASNARRKKEKPGTPCETPGSNEAIEPNPHTEASK